MKDCAFSPNKTILPRLSSVSFFPFVEENTVVASSRQGRYSKRVKCLQNPKF